MRKTPRAREGFQKAVESSGLIRQFPCCPCPDPPCARGPRPLPLKPPESPARSFCPTMPTRLTAGVAPLSSFKASTTLRVSWDQFLTLTAVTPALYCKRFSVSLSFLLQHDF